MKDVEYARYGTNKKKVKASDNTKGVHQDLVCPFCNGKATHRRGKTPHFMVVDRSSHTCEFFSNYLENLAGHYTRETIDLSRTEDGSPVITLNLSEETTLNKKSQLDDPSKNSEEMPSKAIAKQLVQQPAQPKLKETFRFIDYVYDFIRKNEREQILRCTFIVDGKRLKAAELIPTFQDVLRLHEKGTLGELKRFIVGKILSVKQYKNGTVQITLKGQRIDSSKFINAKVIFKHDVIQKNGIDETEFYPNRSFIYYGKPIIDNKEIVMFCHRLEDFDLGKVQSLDGHEVDSADEMHIDNFLDFQQIEHHRPSIVHSMAHFQPNNGVDHFYVPDWILPFERPVVVEYFGFYTEDYLSKKERKIEYFSHLKDWDFIALEKEDLRNNFKGLRQKLLEKNPDLKLKDYEYRG